MWYLIQGTLGLLEMVLKYLEHDRMNYTVDRRIRIKAVRGWQGYE